MPKGSSKFRKSIACNFSKQSPRKPHEIIQTSAFYDHEIAREKIMQKTKNVNNFGKMQGHDPTTH